eukprot:COSAG02_NODE_30348_length_553_cov_0.599119_1_plen_110_part_01
MAQDRYLFRLHAFEEAEKKRATLLAGAGGAAGFGAAGVLDDEDEDLDAWSDGNEDNDEPAAVTRAEPALGHQTAALVGKSGAELDSEGEDDDEGWPDSEEEEVVEEEVVM